jgi:hypothetical protein
MSRLIKKHIKKVKKKQSVWVCGWVWVCPEYDTKLFKEHQLPLSALGYPLSAKRFKEHQLPLSALGYPLSAKRFNTCPEYDTKLFTFKFYLS